jgi:hypothetical protein
MEIEERTMQSEKTDCARPILEKVGKMQDRLSWGFASAATAVLGLVGVFCLVGIVGSLGGEAEWGTVVGGLVVGVAGLWFWVFCLFPEMREPMRKWGDVAGGVVVAVVRMAVKGAALVLVLGLFLVPWNFHIPLWLLFDLGVLWLLVIIISLLGQMEKDHQQREERR